MTLFLSRRRRTPHPGPAALRDPVTCLIAFLCLYTALFALWTLVHWGGHDRQLLIADLVEIPPGAIAAALAWRASRHPALTRQARLAWRLFALGFTCYLAGDVIWFIYEPILHQEPFPSWADAGYMLTYPLVLAGLLVLPVRRREGAERRKFWIDLTTVLVAGVMVVWYLVLLPIALANEKDLLSCALALMYPVLDAALVFGIILTLARQPHGVNRRALYLFIAGISCNAVSDLIFSLLELNSSYQSGDWPDIPWVVCKCLIAAAAWWQFAHANERTQPVETERRRFFSLLPYTAVALGYALLIVAARPFWSGTLGGLLLGAVVLTGLVVARQIIVLRENARLLHEVSYQALHDALTGLPNRRLFGDRVADALARSGGAGEQVYVLFLDLDGFKTVNDSVGHAAGDQLLAAVGRRLQRCVRAGDTVARLGGDEFAIMLDRAATLHDAVEIAERVQESLRTPFALQSAAVRVGVSIGIADSLPGAADAGALLRDADVAMYQAKAAGKDRYVVYERRQRRQQPVFEREAELLRAIAQDQLVLHYQPIIALASGRIGGIESLVRWQRPDGTLVPPSAFIPLAEETALITPLGRWVLQAACAQARQWQLSNPAWSRLMIGVNVSMRQVQQRGFGQEVLELLHTSGLSPRSLVIELTESALLDDATPALDVLHELQAAGVRIALDDFGTGYSSLTHLHRFPVDLLKLDRSFVAEADSSVRAAAVVRTVIKLGEALRLPVVAEGIETPAQLARLRALGCELGQGYLLSPPLDATAMGALLRRAVHQPVGIELPAAG